MQGGIPIGKAFGIPLKLHWSWFIIFALITWALAVSYFPGTYPKWSLAMGVSAGIITSLLFFASVLIHELMHSLVAISEKIHIQGITLFILGGVSEMTEEPKTAGDEFRMAFAGPGSSLVLGGIFLGIFFGLGGTIPAGGSIFNAIVPTTKSSSVQFIGAIAFWLGYINVALGVFNLIPGFPLDGGRVLRSIIWWRTGQIQNATKIAANIGRAIGYIFIAGGIFWLFYFGDLFNGIWLALIGWFLQSAASGSYRQMLIQDMLKGHSASEIMSRDCQTVAPDLTIDKLVNENIMASGRRCFPVTSGGRAEGMITLKDVQKIPREQWNSKTVRDAMTPMDKIKAVTPNEDLSNIMQTLAQNDINQVPVVDDNNVVGIVARDNLVNFINVRAQLNKR